MYKYLYLNMYNKLKDFKKINFPDDFTHDFIRGVTVRIVPSSKSFKQIVVETVLIAPQKTIYTHPVSKQVDF